MSALKENIAKMMVDGPRLRYDYNKWVEARDPDRNKVCIGGCGIFGAGAVWTDDAYEFFGGTMNHAHYLGYREAPIVDSESKRWRNHYLADDPPTNATVDEVAWVNHRLLDLKATRVIFNKKRPRWVPRLIWTVRFNRLYRVEKWAR